MNNQAASTSRNPQTPNPRQQSTDKARLDHETSSKIRYNRIHNLITSFLPPETIAGTSKTEQLDLLLSNLEENHVLVETESEMQQDNAVVYSLINPSDVTFFAESNPPPAVNINEENLFLPFIKRHGLSIAKLQSAKDNLIVKQAKYNTYLSTRTLPNNTPTHIMKLLEKSSNDSELYTIVKLAISEMDQSSRITDTDLKINELKTQFLPSLTTIAAQANLPTIGLTESRCNDLLTNIIREQRLKFALTLENQHSKKERTAVARDLTPLEPPTVENLLARITKLESVKPKKDVNRNNSSKKKTNLIKSKKSKPPTNNRRPRPTVHNASNSRPNPRPRSSTPSTQRGGNNYSITNVRSLPISRQGNQANEIQKLNSSNTSSRINKIFPTISNSRFTNLTNTDLSKFQNILGYGLNYVFPPSKDLPDDLIRTNMLQLINNINWRYWFYMNPTPSVRSYNPTLRLTPTPFPKDLMSPELRISNNNLIRGLDKLISTLTTHTFPFQPLLKEISKLKQTLPSVKFLSSDKNLGLVAMSTIEYHKLALAHLNDRSTYLNHGPISKLSPSFLDGIIDKAYDKLISISKKMKLTNQECKSIKSKCATVPAFHIIPKLHKTPLAGRPIVGAVNWVTTPFSTLLDIKIQQYLVEHTFILRDTTDLTNRWRNQPFDPKIEWLVSLDVTSLYTNIIIEDLTKIVKQRDNHLGEMLDIIMNTNYFEYHDQLFHQTEGLAMGTNCAVSVANLYMAVLVDAKLTSLPEIRLYGRYIDDICFIFKGPKNELDNLIQMANSLHNKVHFTYVASKTELDVLDVTFYHSNLQIEFKTFQKPVNKYLYLPYFSNHPPSTIRGFIIGELIRYSRTNSQYQNELAIRDLFFKRLLVRGYPKSYLRDIFKTSSKKSTRAKPNNDHNSIYVLPYIASPKTESVRKFMNNLDDLILPPPTYSCSTVWSTLPNLSKILLKSKLTLEQSEFLRSNNFDVI